MNKIKAWLSVLLACLMAFSVFLFVGCGGDGEPSGGGKITYKATALADATVGEAYTGTVATATGASDIRYALKEGSSLPAGLTLSQTGRLGGTPTAVAENVRFTVVASAEGAESAEAEFTITVAKQQISYRGTTLEEATVGQAYSRSVATATNAEDITYALKQGSTLPAGLTLSADGTVSGTPTEAVDNATFTVVASADGYDPVEAQFVLSVYYPSFLFEAEWGVGGQSEGGIASGAQYSPSRNGSSGNGYVDFVADKAEFSSVKVEINADKAGTAKLVLGIGLNSGAYTLDTVYTIVVNGTPIEATTAVPASTADRGAWWYDWNPIHAGEISLKEGSNEIEIIAGETALCLDYIRLEVMNEEQLAWFDCTDTYEEVDNFRLPVTDVASAGEELFGTGYEISEVYNMNEFLGGTLGAEGSRTDIKDGLASLAFGDYDLLFRATNGTDNRSMIVPVTVVAGANMFTFEAESGEIAEGEDRDGKPAQPVVGYGSGAKGELSGYVDYHGGGSVTFTVNASAAAEADLVLRFGRVSETHTMADIYVVKINGEALDCGSLDVPAATGRPWYDWYEMIVGTVSLKEGANTIEIIAADSPLILDNIAFAVEDAEITLS